MGTRRFLDGEHSEGEFIRSSKDTIFNRVMTHATLCRAFGTPGSISEHPGVYLAGAPINWQDINICIWLSGGAYWNTQRNNWQEHQLMEHIGV